MNATFAEALAIVLFFVCFWHAWIYEGRAFTQQWFFTGYIFSLIRENLFASFTSFEPFVPLLRYADGIARFGSAPAALALNFVSLTYIAYHFARTLTPGEEFRPMGWRILLIAPALALPLEFVATSLGWWTYPLDEPYRLVRNLPSFVPLAWAASALFFYFVIWRVRRIRFRGNGQLFALVTLSPILGVLGLPLFVVPEFVVGVLAQKGMILVVNTLLALLLIGFPTLELLGGRRLQSDIGRGT